jgi:ubiquinone/menaquinone biosynthesis C-methylase UbiE
MGLRLYREGVLNRGSHERNCQGFETLPTLLMEGSSLEDTDIGVVEDDVERVREFMEMLYRRSDRSAEHCADWMVRWLKPGDSVLDLGGGHGRYAMAFAEKGFEATLFDKAVCVEIAKERCGDRIQTLAGDFHVDGLNGPYDAIFLSNIVHGLDEDTILALLKRLVLELKPGGRVVVKDFHTDSSTHQPETAVMFGMVMLMFTKGGRTYSIGEMQDLLALAGLSPNDPVVATDLGYELLSGSLLA